MRFIDAAERAQLVARFDGIAVTVEALGPRARGRLAEVIEDALEREIAARGGAAPGLAAAGDIEAALNDRLYRARHVGAHAVLIALGSLRGAAAIDGALEPSDITTLRFLARATFGRPLTLLLDAGDEQLGVHARPVPLASVLARDGVIASTPAPAPSPAPALAPAPVPSLVPARTHTAGASIVKGDDAWRHWVLQLTAAKGPQSLATLERLFTQSYVPLASALAAGLDDPRAKLARDEFRRAFEKTYGEACPTFVVTGKRPKMVLDAFDLANRSARLHGARTSQLLLVDGMRWDVGERVKNRALSLLGARASLTDEWLLWSALPTTTPRQLATLARGVDALRSPVEPEQDIESLRGRTAEFVRRMKLGARDVHKLDLVEARVREAGAGALAALDGIADLAAQAIARHAESLAPRTLLFVFGDHGFVLDRAGRDGAAPYAARQGGASPEEVLVPAWALLVGDVH